MHVCIVCGRQPCEAHRLYRVIVRNYNNGRWERICCQHKFALRRLIRQDVLVGRCDLRPNKKDIERLQSTLVQETPVAPGLPEAELEMKPEVETKLASEKKLV